MLRKIEQLRTQPKHVRNRHAFYGAALFTAVVAGFWAVSLPAQLVLPEPMVEENPNDETGGFARALQDIKSQAAAGIAVLQDFDAESGTDTVTDQSDEVGTIDIEAMFTADEVVSINESTSSDTETAMVPDTEARVIMIATTSAARQSSSTDSESE
jgi:hypothetical protein